MNFLINCHIGASFARCKQLTQHFNLKFSLTYFKRNFEHLHCPTLFSLKIWRFQNSFDNTEDKGSIYRGIKYKHTVAHFFYYLRLCFASRRWGHHGTLLTGYEPFQFILGSPMDDAFLCPPPIVVHRVGSVASSAFMSGFTGFAEVRRIGGLFAWCTTHTRPFL